MEVYKTPSKEIQEIILANVTYETVIDGLNKYFESEPRNKYITVKMESDKQDSELYAAEAWADILIEWLRKKHGIFYYPGMEARYAKMEKIRPFTERMMDEGALNGLKVLHKCVTGEEAGTNSHTLIADGIKCAVSAKESEIEKLKKQNEILKGEVRQLNSERIAALDGIKILNAELATKWTKKSLINWLQQSARHKGVELDDAFLYSDDTQYDWQDIVNFLFDEIVKMRGEIEDATETNCKDIMNYIRQEASRNGFELPEEIDGEPLTVKRVFHDLLELMRKRGVEIRNLNVEIKAKESGIEDLKEHITLLEADLKKRTAEIKEVNDKRWNDLRDINKVLGYDGMSGHVDDFAKAVKARAECVKMALGEESDINALIRDYCTKNGIIAPSPYFSDKACVEYLFSVVDLKQKDRSFAILQDLYRDIFKKQPDGLSAEDIANKILDRMLTTEDLRARKVDALETQIKSIFDKYKTKFTIDDYVLNGDPTSGFMLDCISAWIDSPAESRGKTKAEIENHKLKLKDYILKDIKDHGYRYDGLEKKSIEEIVDWIITMATCPRNEWANCEIKKLRDQIDSLKSLINAMNEEVKDM